MNVTNGYIVRVQRRRSKVQSVKTTSTDYKADCLPCHEPARASDWIYIQGYPVLKQ